VTCVYDLPRNREFLDGLAKELKRAMGTGGTVGDGSIELQGDRRERLRELLETKGFSVRG
jgi:translation initiation factor 1